MKRVLILDTETTGLDPKTDRVIEVAAILYSVEHATVLRTFSSLVRGDGNAAEAVNRIPPAALAEAETDDWVWAVVGGMVDEADAIVAHNSEFDRGFTPSPLRDGKSWICSSSDIEWPKQTKPGASLVALALAHDLGVAVAHRALADCDLIARLLTRSRELGADLGALLARGLRPKATFAALVSYENRKLASDAGFRWNQPGFERHWTRRMAIEDVVALPFRTLQVG